MNWKEKKKYETLLARERGVVKKVWGTGLTVCLAYPNLYRIGMANLGFQTVYKIINGSPPFFVRECFCPRGGDAEYAAGARWNTPVWKIKSPFVISMSWRFPFPLGTITRPS